MNLQEAKNLIKQNPGQFYTYLLKRPNGIPFYVGKGNCKGFRIEGHCKEALCNKNGNRYKINTIRKILEDGNQVDYEVVLFTRNEEEAFDKEMELISFYGRKTQGGILTNLTDGGEGVFGHVHSEQSKIKMSESAKGKFVSKETRKRMSISHKGKPGPTTGMNLPTKGIPRTDEVKRKISESLKGKPSSNKGRISPFKGIPRTDEVKRKISDAQKGRPSKSKGIVHSEESKRKMSEGKKRSWDRIKGIE